MGRVENIENLRKKLTKAMERGGDCAVLVGYTAQYAIYVHEMLEMVHPGEPRASGKGEYWGPGFYGPKFLEGPARQYTKELAQIVRDAARSGLSLCKSLLLAGLRLQRESQLRVPVEYGNLRASAFTRVEKGSAE
jgi:hypothetical protein